MHTMIAGTAYAAMKATRRVGWQRYGWLVGELLPKNSAVGLVVGAVEEGCCYKALPG